MNDPKITPGRLDMALPPPHLAIRLPWYKRLRIALGILFRGKANLE